MNVLSLFDGISCGQIALNRAGIKYNNYYASEIDKHAMKVTQHNYPDTIQLGDIKKVCSIDLPDIDLLIGGSPCQGFSFNGKQLNFEDPRSKLFFEYVRLLKECEPKYFLLENVKMKQDHIDVISKHIGVDPVLINSSRVSAQNRERLYWTNIPVGKLPKEDFNFVESILEKEVDPKYYLTNNYTHSTKLCGRNRVDVLKMNYRNKHPIYKEVPVLVSELTHDTPSTRSRQTDRLYSSLSKSPCLLHFSSNSIKIDRGSSDVSHWRTLTPVECERLQTVPDNYTVVIPEAKRFQALGNGWTVDVIAHIFKGLK